MSVRAPSVPAWLPVALALVLTGCSGDGDDERAGESAGGPIVQDASEGPIQATARLDRREWTVGDAIELSLEARAEAGVEVEMPDPGETLGPFEVRDARRPPDVPDGDRRRWTHRFTLETFESGDIEIPALTIHFTDRRGAEPVTGEIAFAPIALSVRSTIAAGADEAELLAMRAPADVGFPAERAAWRTRMLIAVGALALLVAGAAWIMWRRRRGAPVHVATPLSPHEWALRELDRLTADGLLERGEMRSFYFRLTDIARGYIERRFDLAAPDQTTDEFLRVARRHPTLTARDQERLGAFLRGADLVKFARFEPSRADGESAFLLARSFIEETALVEPPRPGRADETTRQEAAPAASSAPRREAAA